jgi:hypothetical protein
MKTQDIRNMGLAMQQVQEASAVQVDELSKGTMGSYIKKAKSDMGSAEQDVGSAKSGAWMLDPKKDKQRDDASKRSRKRKAGIDTAVDKLVKTEEVEVQEAGAHTAAHKPNNGSDPEQGISPNAKKEKDRTSGVGVDANKSIDMSFKAFKAMNKTAPQNGGRTPPGDKAIVKSTTAPAANQKTESVTPGCTCENCTCDPCMCGQDDVIGEKYGGVKKGKPIKGTIMKPVKAAYHGEAMDPVGKADADIDNDGDTDKTDDYLNNRRDAIRSKMKNKKGKGKVGEKAVMHGGKSGEKKNKETMAVGEER